MTVNSVKIKNFRNIADLSFTADNGVNVIYGENAQGKTNILESIWLFTGCKSFRGSKDNELIKTVKLIKNKRQCKIHCRKCFT